MTYEITLDESHDGWGWKTMVLVGPDIWRVVDDGFCNTRWGARRKAIRAARRHKRGGIAPPEINHHDSWRVTL